MRALNSLTQNLIDNLTQILQNPKRMPCRRSGYALLY